MSKKHKRHMRNGARRQKAEQHMVCQQEKDDAFELLADVGIPITVPERQEDTKESI